MYGYDASPFAPTAYDLDGDGWADPYGDGPSASASDLDGRRSGASRVTAR